MRILVLGGTAFLSREVAHQASGAGHDVTCAARGRSGPSPEGVRLLPVDRDSPGDLDALRGEQWDAVVDVARRPSWVRAALAALAGGSPHWTFVSTGSVYADAATPGQRTDSPVLPPIPAEDPDGDNSTPEGYGRNKVACEDAVRAAFGERAFICRAGLIVGPGDPTGRFTYWPVRLAEPGEVLAPGSPDEAVQLIDVRDLAGWLVRAAETGLGGTFDGIGPAMTRDTMINDVASGVGTSPALTWVDQSFLEEHRVAPWMGPRSMPMWLPTPSYAGFMSRDVTASIVAGLTCRPLAETARDTLTWFRADSAGSTTGITRSEEAELLAAWHRERRGAPSRQ